MNRAAHFTWDTGDVEWNLGEDLEKAGGNPCHNKSDGKFCASGKPMAGDKTGVTVKPSKTKAFDGEVKQTKNTLSRLEAGALGEKLVTAYLQHGGLKDARTLNIKVNNFPIDLVADHGVIEVKTGQVSNSKSAQQWRATIGQPGKKETEWLKKATPEQKRAHNEKKAQAILERKQQALADLSQVAGKKIKAYTYGVIINPDTKRADLYRFNGFHLRIGWNTPQAAKGYLGSVSYE